MLLRENKVTNIKSVKDGDTSFIVYVSFQNAKYKEIEDKKYIFFHSSSELEEFKNDLKKAIDAPASDDQRISIEGKEWVFMKTNKFLALSADEGFCMLTTNLDDSDGAKKMLESLNKCVFK